MILQRIVCKVSTSRCVNTIPPVRLQCMRKLHLSRQGLCSLAGPLSQGQCPGSGNPKWRQVVLSDYCTTRTPYFKRKEQKPTYKYFGILADTHLNKGISYSRLRVNLFMVMVVVCFRINAHSRAVCPRCTIKRLTSLCISVVLIAAKLADFHCKNRCIIAYHPQRCHVQVLCTVFNLTATETQL